MGKNHCVSGVNWASIKKFAKFVFGDENFMSSRIVDDRHYIIYIAKSKYYETKKLVDRFEDKFLVNIKPMD